MSFNVKNLSFGAEKEKLDLICRIILDNKIDIVAMQEVLSEGKILTGINQKSVTGEVNAYAHSMKSRLGNRWGMCWRDPQTKAKDYVYLGPDKRGEGYAFLWNMDRVDLLEEDGHKIFPRIFRNYKTNIESDLIRLIRDPCYGQFKVIGRPVEIRLLTTHIVYGKPVAKNLDADLDFGAVTLRKNEFRILAGQIYPKISEYYKQTAMTVPYTIILGDYNLNLSSSGVGKAILPEIMCFDEYGRQLPYDISAPTVINTVQSELSTVSRNGDGLANNYDHFSYDYRVASVVDNNGMKVIRPEKYVKKDASFYESYKNKVSDHLPVVLVIDI